MSAVTEHVEHPDRTDESDPHHVPSDNYFIKIAVFLAVLTALETATYWVHLGPFATPALLIMMSVKFVIIIRVFMHLKFDSPLFSAMFYIGLGLALFVYTVFLATFQFFAR